MGAQVPVKPQPGFKKLENLKRIYLLKPTIQGGDTYAQIFRSLLFAFRSCPEFLQSLADSFNFHVFKLALLIGDSAFEEIAIYLQGFIIGAAVSE